MAEAHVYYDDKVSGALYARLDRLNRLVETARAARRSRRLIVSEQSRLGRHMIQTAHTIMRIADSRVRVFSYLDDKEISVEDEVGQAMTMLQSFGAALERRQGSKRTFDSSLRRVRAGYVTAGKCYGYDNVPVTSPVQAAAYPPPTGPRPSRRGPPHLRGVRGRRRLGWHRPDAERRGRLGAAPQGLVPERHPRRPQGSPLSRRDVWGRLKKVVRKGKAQ